MRSVVLLVATLAGCKPGDWVPSWDDAACPGPWGEQVIARTAAGEVVAATRDGCGFPDAVTEYRLYRDGVLFASGSMQTNHWAHAVTTGGEGTVFWLYDQRCVLGAAALTCATCSDSAPCVPPP